MDYFSQTRFFSSKLLQFDITFWKLMNKCEPTPGKEGIILSSYILGDGQGDWAHLQKEAVELSKKFPERKITLIALAAERHRDKLKFKEIENVDYCLEYFGDGVHCAPMVDKSPFADHNSIIQSIKEASVWLSGPNAIHGIFDDLKTESLAKGLAINEYGFVGNFKNNEFLHTIRLGLGDGEIGIYTNKIKSDYQWDKVENNILKNKLFHTEHIQPSDVEAYLSEHAPFMCYVSNDENALRFIYRALFFGYHQCGKTKIDIIYPSKTDLSELKEGLKNIKKTFPIASITVNDELIEEEGINGFHLRIVHPGRLSKRDFKRIMYLSSSLVGCTGNSSIGLALSYGKIPYYEQLSQTEKTKKNLRQIAARTCGWDSPLVYLLEPVQRFMMINSEERNNLKNNSLIKDAEKLSEVIKDQYSLNGCLRGMVNGLICQNKYPHFANAINQIRDRFLSQNIDMMTAEEEICDEIRKIGLMKDLFSGD